ncbi:hypothetical protein [Asanoa siamensis]|uniref:TIGR03083 family protein n=1 Tax=Asanoa siamensis TaxID=926357 RepID=A0ABQ4CQ43_9ACTN|nr:hypothetical protein [Asanoa siamensis]GIF73390.1 hypothetical protein Asi02nite_29080 [Asanoa siamensis]
MTDDGHPGDLAGAYAIGACTPDEERSFAAHARHCAACAEEAAELSRVAEWVGTATARTPAPTLRTRVLAAARAARAPAGPAGPGAEARRLGALYGDRVSELDGLLRRLSRPQWLVASGPHRSVRDLVVHLRANDATVAAAAGVEVVALEADPRAGWHRQAGAIVDVLRGWDAGLDRPVSLAGRAAVRRSLREALVQRGFETWIHAEDVRVVLGLPPRTPDARQLADIADLAAGLLPQAMAAAGRARPAWAVRLVLTGPGGGTRLVDLAPTAAPGTVVAEVTMPAERFCRLVAGRLASAPDSAEIGGDRGAAVDLLTVAATMGCD